MATATHVDRSLDLLERLLRQGPLVTSEIDAVTRRRWRDRDWDWDDRATRALTLPGHPRSPGMGLLYDRLRRLERDGRAFRLQVPPHPTVLWWS